MPRYAGAIADVMYKGFYWVFGSFLPTYCRGKLKNSEIANADVFSIWISKAAIRSYTTTIVWYSKNREKN